MDRIEGVVVLAGLVIAILGGAYFGALNSDPILSEVINGQNDRIYELSVSLDICNDQQEVQVDRIDLLEDQVNNYQERLNVSNRCFDEFDETNKTIYDAYELRECVG